MPILDYSDKRERFNWFGNLTLLAMVPLLHFAVSVGFWLMWWGASLRNPWLRPHAFAEISAQFISFVPGLCLLMLSAMVYWMALKRRRNAWRLLLVLVVSSAAFFWTDTHFQLCQLNVDFLSGDSRRGGPVYFTWWWYNNL